MSVRKFTPALVTEYFRFFLSIVIVVFLTPYFLKTLGNIQFGIWVTLSSLVGYFGVLDLGLGGAMPKLFAEQLALKDFEKLAHLFSTLFFLLLAAGGLLLFSIFLFSLPLENFLNIPGEYFLVGQTTLVLLSAAFSLSFIANIFYSFLFGASLLHVSNLIGIFSLLLLASLNVFLLQKGFGLPGIATANLIVNGVGLLLAWVCIKKRHPAISIRWKFFDKRILQTAVSLSLYVLVGNVAVRVISSTDNMVISKFLGIQYVAAYAIAFRLCSLASNFVFSFTKIFLPNFSGLQATKDFSALRELFLRCSQIAVSIGVACSIVLFFFGERIIRLWTGPDSFAGQPTLYTLATLLLTQPAIQMGTTTLLGLGKIKVSTTLIVVEALINLALSIFLVRKVGVWGVALGTLSAQLLTNFWFIPYYTTKQIEGNFFAYLQKVFLPSWMLALPSIVLALALRHFYPSGSLPSAMAQILCVSGFYGGTYALWFRKGKATTN